jgi:hypothetical protein
MAEWDDRVVDMVSNFDKISIDVNKDLTLEYNVTAEEKDDLENEVYEIIEQTGLSLDKEGLNVASEIMRNRYVISHFDAIVKAVGEKARSMTDEEWHKKAHNPSAIPKADTPEVQEAPKSLGDMAWDVISKAEGVG